MPGRGEDRLERLQGILRVRDRSAVDDEAVDDRPDAVRARRAVERLGQVLREPLDARLLPRQHVEQRMAAEQRLADPLHRRSEAQRSRRVAAVLIAVDCNAPSARRAGYNARRWPIPSTAKLLATPGVERLARQEPQRHARSDRRRPRGHGPVGQGPQARGPDARGPLARQRWPARTSRARPCATRSSTGPQAAGRDLRALRPRLPGLLRRSSSPGARFRSASLQSCTLVGSGLRRRRPLVHAPRGRRPLRRQPRRRDPARTSTSAASSSPDAHFDGADLSRAVFEGISAARRLLPQRELHRRQPEDGCDLTGRGPAARRTSPARSCGRPRSTPPTASAPSSPTPTWSSSRRSRPTSRPPASTGPGSARPTCGARSSSTPAAPTSASPRPS